MKKVKTLAIVLIVAMMLMGAGYAVWTDSVTIGGNVETGDMNVVIDKAQTTSLKGVNVGYIIVANDKKSADINVEGLVPGGFVEFKLTLKNEGNIVAKVSNLDHISEDLLEDLTISVEGLNEGHEISPGDDFTKEFNVIIELDEDAGNEIQGKGVEFTITPQFTQAFGQ